MEDAAGIQEAETGESGQGKGKLRVIVGVTAVGNGMMRGETDPSGAS